MSIIVDLYTLISILHSSTDIHFGFLRSGSRAIEALWSTVFQRIFLHYLFCSHLNFYCLFPTHFLFRLTVVKVMTLLILFHYENFLILGSFSWTFFHLLMIFLEIEEI